MCFGNSDSDKILTDATEGVEKELWNGGSFGLACGRFSGTKLSIFMLGTSGTTIFICGIAGRLF